MNNEDIKLKHKELSLIKSGVSRALNSLIAADGYLLSENNVEAKEELESAFHRIAPLAARIYNIRNEPEQRGYDEIKVDKPFLTSHPKSSFERDSIFRCDVSVEPLLKCNPASKYLSQIIGAEIEDSIVPLLGQRTHRFKKINVIFVNRFCKSHSGKQPYFDNDNLLIKKILDSIVAFICYDDAFCYCTNIYTYQYDDESGFSVYVVEEGHLFEWAHIHKDVVFAKELLGGEVS